MIRGNPYGNANIKTVAIFICVGSKNVITVPVIYTYELRISDLCRNTVELKSKRVPSRAKNTLDRWMTCDFTSFPTIFQSYQDNERLIMNGCVH